MKKLSVLRPSHQCMGNCFLIRSIAHHNRRLISTLANRRAPPALSRTINRSGLYPNEIGLGRKLRILYKHCSLEIGSVVCKNVRDDQKAFPVTLYCIARLAGGVQSYMAIEKEEGIP